MARILFITDELPFPPKNGVTIPAFHFLSRLAVENEVSLLFLQSPWQKAEELAIKANRRFVKNLWVLNLMVKGRMESVVDEVFCRKPYFASSSFNSAQCAQLLSSYDCDVLWATPIGPFVQISAIEACMPVKHPRLRIAAINDSYTSVLRSFANRVLGTKWPLSARAQSAVKWMRSWGMASMEARILGQAHYILVQSRRDKAWIGHISKGSLLKKVTIIPNGVNSLLLEGNLSSCEKPVFGHIGPLFSPSHYRTIRWILDDVLPDVRRFVPECRFSILGKAGSSRLMERINKNNSVEYTPKVKEMKDFYQTISVLLVRNYKCIGLINRTVEALAAGVVVIGERGAFNGIDGFQHGVHGFVAESTRETVDCLVNVLSNKSIRKSVSHAARNLIQSKFRWTDRISLANSLIEDGISGLRRI